MHEPGTASFEIQQQHLVLSPRKALFWKEQRILLISDLHIGKAGHFRKSGIAVPGHVHLHDQDKLRDLISIYRPEKVVFLGDLFHSDHNMDWPVFNLWLDEFSHTQFILVRGNHDILPEAIYQDSALQVVSSLLIEPFLLTHQEVETDHYNISGHIHPAIRLSGAARQSVRVPCFYFGEDKALMPAFGIFTGFVRINVTKADRVFAITDKAVIPLS